MEGTLFAYIYCVSTCAGGEGLDIEYNVYAIFLLKSFDLVDL